jgi:hypothetical protein
VLVLAVNVNGDDSTAPLEGVTTVMADTGMDDPTNTKSARMRFFMDIPQKSAWRLSVKAKPCASRSTRRAERSW